MRDVLISSQVIYLHHLLSLQQEAIIIATVYLLATAHLPISIFFAGPVGEISKSKISIGSPNVMHAFGICKFEISAPILSLNVAAFQKEKEKQLTSTKPPTCP